MRKEVVFSIFMAFAALPLAAVLFGVGAVGWEFARDSSATAPSLAYVVCICLLFPSLAAVVAAALGLRVAQLPVRWAPVAGAGAYFGILLIGVPAAGLLTVSGAAAGVASVYLAMPLGAFAGSLLSSLALGERESAAIAGLGLDLPHAVGVSSAPERPCATSRPEAP